MINKVLICCICGFLTSIIIGCDYIRYYNGGNYNVTKEYIKGKSKIEYFTISLLDVKMVNEEGIPIGKSEIDRYCCKIKNTDPKRKVFFNEKNDGYVWFKCNVDYRFVEVDSLKNLSIEEKLALTKSSKPIFYDTMPFIFEKGEWYSLFALKDVYGLYYIHVKDNNDLEVKYYDGGNF